MALSDANRTWILKIVGDVDDAKKSLGNIEKSAGSFGTVLKKVGGVVAAAFSTAAIIDFGKQIVTAASNTEQALGGSRNIFKEYAGDIEAFSKTTAKSLGVSQEEFLSLSNLTGSLLKNQGVPLKETANLTKDLTTRAADLAAMYGGNVGDALSAINSALKGEMNPLENFGVSLRASAVQAKAQAMGLTDAEGKVTDYGRSMATTALIMEQSADAAGQFGRESDTLAGRQAVLKAQWADMQVTLGQKLLPAVTAVAGYVVNDMLPAFQQMYAWIEERWPAIYAQYIEPVMRGIQETITQVIAIITEIWNRWGEDITAFVVHYFGFIKNFINDSLQVIKGLFDIIMGILSGDWSRVWDGLKNVVAGVVGNILNILQDLVWKLGFLFLPVLEAIARPFIAAFDWVRNIVGNVVNWFGGVPGAIGRAMSTVGSYLTRPFYDAANAINSIWGTVNRAFLSSVTWLVNLFSGVANAIAAPFKAAFGYIKQLWNSTIGGFGFTVPSWVPGLGGKGWTIPRMARGGIVDRPTIALIGEAGPEAVVPLNGRNGTMGTTIFNVYALTANAEVGRKVWEALREYERVNGGARVAG